MRRLVLAVLALTSIALLCVSCGDSSKTATAKTAYTLAFLQQKPNSNLFYPVLANISGSQFNTYMVEDASTSQPVSAAIGSIVLNAKGDKAVLEVYGGIDEAAPTDQWDIYIGTVDGANLMQVTNDAYTDEVPSFNPPGTKIIYTSYRNEIPLTVVRNTDGTGEQIVPLPASVEGTWHPSYSPDGSAIVMEAWGSTDGVPFYGILKTNADGSSPTLLTNPYSENCWCGDEQPFFTSNGMQIAFSREDWAAGTEDIYIMNADGTGVTKLTDGLGYNADPIVVKDSASKADVILFSSNRDNLNAGASGFELYTMKPDGSGLTRLTYNTLYDGFNLWLYETMQPGSAVRSLQRAHEPRPMQRPAQRLRW